MEGFIGYSECGFSWGREEVCCKRELNTHFNNILLSNGTLQSFYIISEYFILFFDFNDPLWSCKKVGCYKKVKIVNSNALWMYVVMSKVRIHYYTSWSVVGVILYFLLKFWNEKMCEAETMEDIDYSQKLQKKLKLDWHWSPGHREEHQHPCTTYMKAEVWRHNRVAQTATSGTAVGGKHS